MSNRTNINEPDPTSKGYGRNIKIKLMKTPLLVKWNHLQGLNLKIKENNYLDKGLLFIKIVTLFIF